MTREEITALVYDIVADQFGVDKSELTLNTRFIEDLAADSLDTVELLMEFEDEFEWSVPDEEADKIMTIGEAVEYIVQHRA